MERNTTIFDDDDLADFQAAREHDYSVASCLRIQGVEKHAASSNKNRGAKKNVQNIILLQETTRPRLQHGACASEMFTEDDLEDFKTARDHEFTSKTLRGIAINKNLADLSPVPQMAAMEVKIDSPRSTTKSGHVDMKRETGPRYVGLGDVTCTSEFLDEDDLSDLLAARGHDYSVASVANMKLGAPILKNYVNTKESSGEELINGIVCTTTQKSDDKGAKDIVKDISDQQSLEDDGWASDKSPQVADSPNMCARKRAVDEETRRMLERTMKRAADLDLLNAVSIKSHEGESPDEKKDLVADPKPGKHGNNAVPAIVEISSPVTPSQDKAEEWSESTFDESSRSARYEKTVIPRPHGVSMFGKKNTKINRSQPLREGGETEESGKASAITTIFRRATEACTHDSTNPKTIRSASFIVTNGNRTIVETRASTIMTGVLGGSLRVSKGGRIRARVPVSNPSKQPIHHVSLKVVQVEEQVCRLVLRRRFGDPIRITNQDFVWLCAQVHEELSRNLQVEAPTMK